MQDHTDTTIRSRIAQAIRELDNREVKMLLRDIVKILDGPVDLKWMGQLFKVSAAELQVVELLVSGKTHKQISDHLGKATSTVASQIHSVYKKTRVSNQAELMALILQNSHKHI